ncbi:hypothetical protein Anas_00598 [Armadillidium nasatum]|uniref:Uncharacterized protein n=1 Tax=Armadillidium nasatum TaxID=96803 RepID=A0A5N5TJK0_9CRUS|nr:hypothetical protein Anas_00598 [Armadillidium nasatum]
MVLKANLAFRDTLSTHTIELVTKSLNILHLKSSRKRVSRLAEIQLLTSGLYLLPINEENLALKKHSCLKLRLKLPNLVFVDEHNASKDFFGCVIYLNDPNTHSLHFLTAKNKIVSSKGVGRTIPVMELFAVAYGVVCDGSVP